MALSASSRLQDRYEVVRPLKSGGMGAVYEAIDHKLAGTPCALKEVLEEALQGPDAAYILSTFDQEVRSLATLEHPCIPRVRDSFEDGGRRYLVMDLVRGESLEDELQRTLSLTGQALDPELVVQDMISVLDTLSYLHEQQPAVVHRDVKPANLIRDDRSGSIKLVDFGLARAAQPGAPQTQVGTPGYCAPEQRAGHSEIRSDLFSVGATLFQLCSGRTPPAFSLTPLQLQLPGMPALEGVVARATAFAASDRFSSAREMADALRLCLTQSPVPPPNTPSLASGRTEAAAAAATAPLPAPRRGRVRVLRTVAVVLLVAWGLRFRPAPTQPRSETPSAPLASAVDDTGGLPGAAFDQEVEGVNLHVVPTMYPGKSKEQIYALRHYRGHEGDRRAVDGVVGFCWAGPRGSHWEAVHIDDGVAYDVHLNRTHGPSPAIMKELDGFIMQTRKQL